MISNISWIQYSIPNKCTRHVGRERGVKMPCLTSTNRPTDTKFSFYKDPQMSNQRGGFWNCLHGIVWHPLVGSKWTSTFSTPMYSWVDRGGGGPGGPDPHFLAHDVGFALGPKSDPLLAPLFLLVDLRWTPPPFQKSWIRPWCYTSYIHEIIIRRKRYAPIVGCATVNTNKCMMKWMAWPSRVSFDLVLIQKPITLWTGWGCDVYGNLDKTGALGLVNEAICLSTECL